MQGRQRVERTLLEHRAAVGCSVGVVCLALAGLWLLVVPDEADSSEGLTGAILAYGHTAVWALLGTAAFLFAIDAPRRAVAGVGTAALVAYVAFVLALVGA